jgi:hypothetical protein
MSYEYLCENSICLQAEEAVSSAESFSDIPAYVLSRLNLTAAKSCSKGNETESFQSSQSGTTCERSTESLGAEKSILFAAVSHAKTLASEQIRPEEEKALKESEADYGDKWLALSMRCNPDTFSLKTVPSLVEEDLPASSVNLPEWGMMRNGELFTPQNLASIIFVEGCSFMPTVTATHITEKVNPFDKKTMWRAKSGWVEKASLSGKRGSINWSQWMLAYELAPTPKAAEYLMGWPMGWTDLNPLATDKFQQWLSSHGKP